ncbi:SwmB domain-containing protein, partial [Cohnella sp. AR92]|uniref:SwmB domain-containing protein n=1 Tax=Cohnella sp. AR92 TaxID=648716 RepID=UPI000F916D1C
MKATGRTNNRRRSLGERMLLMAAAWAMAVALAFYAGPSRANAAVGNAAWGGSSPADGSVINQFTGLSVVWNDPDGDQFQNGGYKVRRLSDGKYLQYSNDPGQVWTGDGSSWSVMMNDGSGAYHLPFDAFLQESLQEEGEYEFSFFANEYDGTTTNSNYHYGVRITLDKTPPHLSNAVVSKNYLTFDLTEQPVGSSWQTTDFDVQVNGVSVPLDFVAPVVGSDTLLVQLSSPVSSGDEVTVSYAGTSFADAAGNAVSVAPVAADNGTPGRFEGNPALLFRMQAGYTLKAGEPIIRFTPSKSGATFIQFDPPNAASNPPGINAGAIKKTDFVIKDLTDDSVIQPAAASGTSDPDFNVYRMYWVLPSSLQEGHAYELALSDTAGGDELTLPAVPTSEATASLLLQQSALTLDEYEFASLELPEVYLAGLAAAVSEAQDELDAAVEGTANGQYAAGAKAALQAAIDEAAAWLDSPGATQAEIDQALEVLEDALVAFDSKRVFVNSLALREAIETAQDLYDSAVEGTSNGQYAAGAKAALQAAIDEAAAWLDSPGATQAEIDQALEDLEDALEAFDSKRVFVNYFPLRGAIEAAQDLYDSAVEGTSNGQYAAGAKAALQAAIDEAAAWLDSPGATQAEIDQALGDLEDALVAFDSKRVFVNSLALREAIETAQDLYDSAVEGTSNGQYAAGAKAALQAAIDEAAAWLDSPGATQAEIDQALEDLEDALEAFDSKRVFVNYFALRGAIETAQDLYCPLYTS